MSKEAAQNPSADIAVWFDGKSINEVIFCEEFLRDYPMITVNGTFFTVNGIVNDENRLKKEIYDRIKPYVTSNIAKRVTNLLDVMRMECEWNAVPMIFSCIKTASMWQTAPIIWMAHSARKKITAAIAYPSPIIRKLRSQSHGCIFCPSFWSRRTF